MANGQKAAGALCIAALVVVLGVLLMKPSHASQPLPPPQQQPVYVPMGQYRVTIPVDVHKVETPEDKDAQERLDRLSKKYEQYR